MYKSAYMEIDQCDSYSQGCKYIYIWYFSKYIMKRQQRKHKLMILYILCWFQWEQGLAHNIKLFKLYA